MTLPNRLTVLSSLGALAVVAGLLFGCGCAGSGAGTGPTGPAGHQPDRWPTPLGTLSTDRAGCEVLDGPVRPGGRFVVAVTDPVRPDHAPVPRNPSERLLFAQLYETLVDVTCDGRLAPGLAINWTCTEDSTTWVFTLREDARFWDGTRVTAEAVRRSWAANQGAAAAGSASPWKWINARAASITAVDGRRLAIQLPEPQARFPYLLAHPAAAVAIRQPGWTWPVGSGPVRLRASDPAPLPDLNGRPNAEHPRHPGWQSLVFHVAPGRDPRDLVGTDFDLVLAHDLDSVNFFTAAPGFSCLPLPWNRLYLLVCPPQSNPAGSGRWARAAAALQPARDLTRIAARAWPHLMFPLASGEACPQLSGPISARRAAPLDSDLARIRLDRDAIAFEVDDPGGTELAGRLSHLAGSGTRVAGLAASDLDLALQWQMAGAIVVAQDQLFPTGCLQLAALLGRAAWLQQAGMRRPAPGPTENLVQAEQMSARAACDPATALTAAGVVYPLALSHDWLVVHGDLAGLRLDFDGTPLLDGLGRAAAPEAVP